MAKTLKHETIKQVKDKETGEWSEMTTSKTFAIPVNEEEFYMTFIKSLSSILNLNSFTEVKVLVRLCEIAEFNTGKVSLTAGKRTEFIESLSINKAYLSSSIKSLINKGLLKGDKGEYQINPLVFWKGSLKERNALIKENGEVMNVKIDFNCPDYI